MSRLWKLGDTHAQSNSAKPSSAAAPLKGILSTIGLRRLSSRKKDRRPVEPRSPPCSLPRCADPLLTATPGRHGTDDPIDTRFSMTTDSQPVSRVDPISAPASNVSPYENRDLPVVTSSLPELLEVQPEPLAIARCIRSMLNCMPRFPFSTPQTQASQEDTNYALTANSHLVSLLSSASIMNGSISTDRESVWSMLDRLNPISSRISLIQAAEIGDAAGPPEIMVYGPLLPAAESEAEVAQSEIISLDDSEVICDGGDARTQSTGHARPSAVEVTNIAPEAAVTNRKEIREKIVWIPSTTKISLEATWWGYRIYLPPPVLSTLNNRQFEAAKRAALITTALKWLLDHLPSTMLPPQFRFALATLRRLVPMLGAIGTFIAWSWSAIKTFDKGRGVILSATWLLPVVLIPGTWEEDGWPIHSPPRPPPSES